METMQRYSDTKKFKAIVQSLDIQCRNAKAVVVKTIRTPLFIPINGNFVVNGFVLDIIRCFINSTIENIP